MSTSIEKSLQGISIYLIGMMGVGKSTIGKLLAHQLSYRFFDTDVLIERVTQKSIPEIFAESGEDSFRELEHQVLQEISVETKSVIATGGGIVERQINWSYLQQGLIIWLDVEVEVLKERLAGDNNRPLADKLELLLQKRHSLYAQADLRIKIVATQTPEDIVQQILELIPRVIKSESNFSHS
ncbi:MAG: shikimate kinase [Stanieria sp.]